MPLRSPVTTTIKRAILLLIALKRQKTSYRFGNIYVGDWKYGG